MRERVIVRALALADIEALARAFEPAPYRKSRAQYERYLAEHAEGERVTLVALVGAEVAGYVSVLWDSGYPAFAASGTPEISDLNVLEPLRGRGIGTALIRAAEGVVRGAGHTVVGIGVGTTPDYDAARRLYPALGYVFDGAPPTDHGHGATEWLTKRLG